MNMNDNLSVDTEHMAEVNNINKSIDEEHYTCFFFTRA